MVKQLQTALRAARIYLGSVDFCSVRDQDKLYRRAMREATKVSKITEMDLTDVWDQLLTEARVRGHIRPMPGKDI